MSARQMAAQLIERGIATPNGGRWHAATVLRAMSRCGLSGEFFLLAHKTDVAMQHFGRDESMADLVRQRGVVGITSSSRGLGSG
jgi:hypothetical protein